MAASFDAEAVIAQFLATSDCASLELPCSLTAEERKYVKSVAERHSGIKCESFGMGKDRKLHLFKCNLGGTSVGYQSTPSRVSIKNTFIDDWVDSEGTPVDSRAVQSMPHNMFGRCLSAEPSAHGSSPGQQNVHEEVHSPTVRCLRWAEEPVVVEEQESMPAIHLGAEVVIDGLVKAPSFNGAVGIVQSWDAESGRFNVLLSPSNGCAHRNAKIKADNLRHRRVFQASML